MRVWRRRWCGHGAAGREACGVLWAQRGCVDGWLVGAACMLLVLKRMRSKVELLMLKPC